MVPPPVSFAVLLSRNKRMLRGPLLQGTVFGNIAVVLAGFDRLRAQLSRRRRMIGEVARIHGLPRRLQRRMEESVQFQWSQVQVRVTIPAVAASPPPPEAKRPPTAANPDLLLPAPGSGTSNPPACPEAGVGSISSGVTATLLLS
jgi:hypothetical protein